MSVEQNKATVRRIYDEVWNKGNMEVIPELVSPDYIYDSPAGAFKGHEGYKQLVTVQRDAMPDLHFTIDNVIGEGDWLATQLSWSGTFTGKMGDTEPTGKKANMKQVVITRYVDGKTVEAVPYLNTLSLYQQLGISPPTQ